MFCKECGAEIEEGSKFCPECGTSISKSVKEEKPKKVENIKKDGVSNNSSKLKKWAIISSIVVITLFITVNSILNLESWEYLKAYIVRILKKRKRIR